MNAKARLRKAIAERRRALTDKESKSYAIHQKLSALPEFILAQTILFYLNTAEEVATQPYIEPTAALGKNMAVPFLGQSNEIQLLKFNNCSDLAPGAFGILEPRLELRGLAERRCPAEELDLVLVPGVAFDLRGGRLGRGKGCYDRFLSGLPAGIPFIGLAFDCQLVPEVPMDAGDVYVDIIISEIEVHDCRKLRGRS